MGGDKRTAELGASKDPDFCLTWVALGTPADAVTSELTSCCLLGIVGIASIGFALCAGWLVDIVTKLFVRQSSFDGTRRYTDNV